MEDMIMKKAVSLSALKALVESKIKKKTVIKIIWNDTEKITLFITPNMKINSFIYDEKDGYLFYDTTGNPIAYTIPCILTEEVLVDGQVLLVDELFVNKERLSKEDRQFLVEYS
jgi:hypothetical protein